MLGAQQPRERLQRIKEKGHSHELVQIWPAPPAARSRKRQSLTHRRLGCHALQPGCDGRGPFGFNFRFQPSRRLSRGQLPGHWTGGHSPTAGLASFEGGFGGRQFQAVMIQGAFVAALVDVRMHHAFVHEFARGTLVHQPLQRF